MKTATKDAQDGAAVYSPLVLKLYDLWVLGLSNRLAWTCPTRRTLLPFFQRHIGPRHLDVGVGTGFYPANTKLRADQQITLLDLNENSLNAAGARIADANPRLVHGDILSPGTMLAGERFDSISLFYLLHCLPGTMAEKGEAVFGFLKDRLDDQGVVYGATILGDSAGHNGLGRKLMNVYNAKGIFGNRTDTREELDAVLRRHFTDVSIEQCGRVALFTARGPIA